MTNLEIIEELRNSTFTDEDGSKYTLEFRDGLSDKQIENFREIFPNKTISSELIEILRTTKGWDGYGLEMVYFDSIGEFGFTELSPNSIVLGHDGSGNYWILDITDNGELGKVFFACHDPAVFIIHSQNLNEYLNHLLEFYRNPENCHLNTIHDKSVIDVWKKNNSLSSKSEFAKSNPEFENFLGRFEGDEWTIADLRAGKNKDGFPWGKLGPNQYTERHPTELVWIIKNRKKGFLSKLFGK